MPYLIFACLLLVAGPVIYQKIKNKSHRLHRVLMILLALSVLYFSFGHIIPRVMKGQSFVVGLTLVFGFLFVAATERLWVQRTGIRKVFPLICACVGITAHSLLDGVAIAIGTSRAGYANNLWGFSLQDFPLVAIILVHQIPVSIFLFSLTLEIIQSRIAAWSVIFSMVAATCIGYFAIFAIVQVPSVFGSLYLIEAFVVGSLVHIAIDPFIHRGKVSCGCAH